MEKNKEVLPSNFFIPMKKSFFIHVGKTAGSSFNKFLQTHLLGKVHCEIYCQPNQPFLLNELDELKSFDFISGHLMLSCFNQNFIRDQYFLVTILREPFSQIISMINWISHIHNSDHNSPFYLSHTEYIKEMASELNLCFRNLSDVSQAIEFLERYGMFKNHQSRFFQTNFSELNSAEIIENLLSFDLVGLTENYSQFIHQYISLIGGEDIILPSLDKVNINNNLALDTKTLINDKSFVDFINEYNRHLRKFPNALYRYFLNL